MKSLPANNAGEVGPGPRATPARSATPGGGRGARRALFQCSQTGVGPDRTAEVISPSRSTPFSWDRFLASYKSTGRPQSGGRPRWFCARGVGGLRAHCRGDSSDRRTADHIIVGGRGLGGRARGCPSARGLPQHTLPRALPCRAIGEPPARFCRPTPTAPTPKPPPMEMAVKGRKLLIGFEHPERRSFADQITPARRTTPPLSSISPLLVVSPYFGGDSDAWFRPRFSPLALAPIRPCISWGFRSVRRGRGNGW